MSEYRRDSRESSSSPQMFGLMHINLVPESESVDKKGRTATRKGEYSSEGIIDPLDWELHLQTVAQQKKNQEEEAVRQRRRMVEHYKSKAAVQMRIRCYKKAAYLYTKVLELDAVDMEALLFRAECYYEMQKFQETIKDTRATLALDGKIAKAYSIQGDAQFQLTLFEEALISYQRANRYRPGVRQYQEGINRVESVINRAIGENNGIKLDLSGDLSYFDQFSQKTKENPGYIRATKPIQRQSNSASTTKSSARQRDTRQAKTIKELLGELYGDYSYLQELRLEEDKKLKQLQSKSKPTSKEVKMKPKRVPQKPDANEKWKQTSEFVRDTVARELAYLSKRAEFLRHLKSPRPCKENESETSRLSRASSVMSVTSPEELLEMIEGIEADQAAGHYDQSLKKSQKALDFVQGQVYSELPNRDEFEATLNSLMGNVYFEQADYLKALDYYEEDLSIARACKGLEEAEARAMDNIGRVYAKMERFNKAIEIFEERVEKAKTSLELTWLHHELGRCYFETRDIEKALQHAEKSLDAALEAEDRAWQLNAMVLKAQALEEQKNFSDALEVFQAALDVAEQDKDKQARLAIVNAIDHIKDKQQRQEQNELDVDHTDEAALRMKLQIQEANAEQDQDDRTEATNIRDMIRETSKSDHDGDNSENSEMKDEKEENVQNSDEAVDTVDNERSSSSQSNNNGLKETKEFRDALLSSNAKAEKKEARDFRDSIKSSSKNNASKGGQAGGKKASAKGKQVTMQKGDSTKGKTNVKKEATTKHSVQEKPKKVKASKDEQVDETNEVNKRDNTKDTRDKAAAIEVGKKGDGGDHTEEQDKDDEQKDVGDVALDAEDIRDMINDSSQLGSKEREPKQEKDDFYD